MDIRVRPYGKEEEKRLVRVLAEVALELGKAEAMSSRCETGDGVGVGGSCADAVQEEVCNGETSSRVLPCIDDLT
ncbi:MAG: hypothetical protein IIX11_05965 [Selenomonadales bacterium]|nr:hypothetical protein [Selenomonadales bacterium]MBQ5859362.1 hypothetical protein [Selenomonadales bacterium]MBR0325662.1 hypothetical protein [Selenomonadales bacterium]